MVRAGDQRAAQPHGSRARPNVLAYVLWRNPARRHKEDVVALEDLIRRHLQWTNSLRAQQILDRWRDMVGRFVRVMPIDYRRALERLRQREQRETETTPATEEVFNG